MSRVLTIDLEMPQYGDMFDTPADFYCLSGGRGAAKSWTVAFKVMCWATLWESEGVPWQFACVREFQANLDESVKPLLDATMMRMGISDLFTFKRGLFGLGIYGKSSGGRIFFSGMSTVSEEGIKGWESLKGVWYDEAHRMSPRSWELLVPTVRIEGSRIVLTYNPATRQDVPWLEFWGSPPRRSEHVVKRHVTYRDNKWFTARNERDRQHSQKTEPERYEHIWEGKPDEAGEEFKLLPYATLTAIANADTWQLRPAREGRAQAGYDVAAQGNDNSALVLRTGPTVHLFDERAKQKLSKVVDWVDGICIEHAAAHLYYDVTGVGEAVRAQYEVRGKPPYAVTPEQFGGSVQQRDRRVVNSVKNKDFFERRNAQMGWELRRRARNTLRLLDGEDVDKDDCLFIDPRLPGLDKFLSELSQPVWEEQSTGKVRLIKAPDGAPSPNYFDAACLAFAGETRQWGRRAAWDGGQCETNKGRD